MKIRLALLALALTALGSPSAAVYGQYPVIPGYGVPGQTVYSPATGDSADANSDDGAYEEPILSYSRPGRVVEPAAFRASEGACDVGCTTRMTSCDGKCGGSCETCCASCAGYCHGWYFYGEFMYLRPRDSEVAWASPIDGPIVPGPVNNNPIQIQSLGVADLDFQPGWRGGFQYTLSECTGFQAQYTMYEATTNDSVRVTAPNVIRSQVSHPGTLTAAQDFLAGQVQYQLNYDELDFEFRRLVWYDTDFQIGYNAGVSLVQMEQQFQARFSGTGTETVRTDIDFYGAGCRFGLFGEVEAHDRLRFYARGTGNLLAGVFHADYDQGQSYDPQVVDTAWRAGRIVGIWEIESGVKWVSCCGNYSANVGYMYSAWTNTVQTDEWIQAVRTNRFIGLDNTMTFDGLVARFEVRY